VQRRAPEGHVVPPGSKWCPDCERVLPLTDFVKTVTTKSGHSAYCKPCHNTRSRKSREKFGGSRTYHLTRRYGITAAEADHLLALQGGVRAICRAAPADHVDHDHGTGAVRLLCFNCDGGLGQFKDDPGLLHLAAFYVEHHNQQQALALLGESAADVAAGPSRPGTPPVGSQRPPGARSTSSRSTGRRSGARRRRSAGEADG
jgi:hypothetical protein